MKTKQEPITFFDLLEHRKPVGTREDILRETNVLLERIYKSRVAIEKEILTSKYFYQRLLDWTDQINKKQITIKDILARGTYTKSELKAKLGAFLLNLKAFKKMLEDSNAFEQEDMYESWKKFGFNANKITEFKEQVLTKRVKTDNETYLFIKLHQAIVNACCGRLVELYAPMAIEAAGRRGIQYTDEGDVFADYQDDLIQAGMIGIYQAALHWEPGKEASFSTYAWYWMASETAKFFNSKDLVMLPRNLISLRNKINKISTKFGIAKSNISDFKKYAKYSDKRIEAAMIHEGCISLNDLIADDYETEEKGIDFLTDGQDIVKDVQLINTRELINDILTKCLDNKEIQIMNVRFGLNGHNPHDLKEVAEQFNMTTEGIRKSIKNSILKTIPSFVEVFGEDYDLPDLQTVLDMHC